MKYKPLKIVGIVIFGALAIAGFGYLFMWLWNWLVPTLFNGPVVSYWQGVGLLVLSKILLGGPGGRGGKCCCKGGGGWKNRWKEKFENMDDTERNEFKNRMKAKFCNNRTHEQSEIVTPQEDGSISKKI